MVSRPDNSYVNQWWNLVLCINEQQQRFGYISPPLHMVCSSGNIIIHNSLAMIVCYHICSHRNRKLVSYLTV